MSERRLILTEAEARVADRVFYDDGRTCRIIPEIWYPGKEPAASCPLGLPSDDGAEEAPLFV